MGEKRVELPRGSTRRQKQPVQLTAAEFFLLLTLLGPCEKVAVAFAGWLGPRISEAFGLKWQDLDLNLGVVSFRQGCVQGRITPLKTEASRTNARAGGGVGVAARVALRHDLRRPGPTIRKNNPGYSRERIGGERMRYGSRAPIIRHTADARAADARVPNPL